MLDYVINQTNLYIDNIPKSKRKKIGQFFTSAETAKFMAGLFDIPSKEHLDILDPGTGSAILTAALLNRIEIEAKHVKSVSLTCYEIEPAIFELLKNNLQYIKSQVSFVLEYKIITENYITSQVNPLAFADLIIGNPPYLKVPRLAAEAQAMQHVVYGAPNLYFLFAARSIENLCRNGQMVYIIPRSWTSGAYFKTFRNFLFANAALKHIHLFVSRDKVFEKESVLQETMIIKVQKNVSASAMLTVTSTETTHDFNNIQKISVPSQLVIGNDDNQYVYLVTNKDDVAVLDKLSVFTDTLPSLNLRMKTGLTVDFREKSHLMDEPAENNIPMFFAQHLKDGGIVFPIGKHGEYIDTSKPSLVQPNANYLFVKRFTTKEESRRLQCSIYLKDYFPSYEQISTHNKINFVTDMKNELSTAMVYGLFCIFNSSIYDRYYRILNGSTQVNSTEVNTMPMPSLDGIEYLGQQLMEQHDLTENICNTILEEYINGEIRRSKKIS